VARENVDACCSHSRQQRPLPRRSPWRRLRRIPASPSFVRHVSSMVGAGNRLLRQWFESKGDKITAGRIVSAHICGCASDRSRGRHASFPGFIDLHTHLTGRSDVHWEDALVKTNAARRCALGRPLGARHPDGGFYDCSRHGSGLALHRCRAFAMRSMREPSQGRACWSQALTCHRRGGAGRCPAVLPLRPRSRWYTTWPMVRRRSPRPWRTNFKNGADFIKILATGGRALQGHCPGCSAVFGRGASRRCC